MAQESRGWHRLIARLKKLGAKSDDQRPDDTKPDPRTADTVDRFLELLRAYRIWHGKPSYGRMAKAEAKHSAATFSAAARGPNLPTMDVLVGFIRGCYGCNDSASPSEEEADIEAWKTAWRRLSIK